MLFVRQDLLRITKLHLTSPDQNVLDRTKFERQRSTAPKKLINKLINTVLRKNPENKKGA